MSSNEDRLRDALSAAADSVRPGDGAWADNAERLRRDRRTRRVLPASLAVVVLGAGLAIWRIPDWDQGRSPAIVAVAPTASPSAHSKPGACDKAPNGGVAYMDGFDMGASVSLSVTDASHGSLLCYQIRVDRQSGSASMEGVIEPTFVKGHETNAFPYLGTAAVGDTSWLLGVVADEVDRLEATWSDGERHELSFMGLGEQRAFTLITSGASEGPHPVMLTAIGADGQVLGEVGIGEDSR